jgi:hypothetical protein
MRPSQKLPAHQRAYPVVAAVALLIIKTESAWAQQMNLPTEGLVAHYPLDGNAEDYGGKMSHGIVTGALPTTNRDGVPGKAYSFTQGPIGSYDWIEVPFFQQFTDLSAFTLSAWIRVTGTNFVSRFLSTEGADFSGERGFRLGVNAADHPSGGGDRTGLPRFYLGTGWGGGGEDLHSSPSKYAFDTWYHVVGTYDGTKAVIYVDGNLDAEKSMPGLIIDSDQYLQIARYKGSSNPPFFAGVFQGDIDDVRIYNRALSEAEVRAVRAYDLQCTPHQAKATLQIVNGFIVGATITDPGCGYTSPPTVIIKSSTGAGATASATIADGSVSAIAILSAGSGYTEADPPEILIASPPFEPRLEIRPSRVIVDQYVVLGRKYQLESSTDLAAWTPIGEAFVATSERYTSEIVIGTAGQHFRLREVR